MSEDSSNTSSDEKIPTPEIYKCCDNPQITYNAPVNINVEECTIGSVDVWRCASCKRSFCEEKQLGIESITDIVGMPRIEDDEKWAVVVSKLQKGKDKWKLVKLKVNGILKFGRKFLGKKVRKTELILALLSMLRIKRLELFS